MKNQKGFKIIGIGVKTTNENNQSANDMGDLWGRFFSESISGNVPNRISDDLYSIYTDYETDYKGAYTAILGHPVSSLDSIPEGFIGREFEGGNYKKFTAKGKIPDAIIETWMKIWSLDDELERSYTADYEIHGEKSQNGDSSEVDIFIAIK